MVHEVLRGCDLLFCSQMAVHRGLLPLCPASRVGYLRVNVRIMLYLVGFLDKVQRIDHQVAEKPGLWMRGGPQSMGFEGQEVLSERV